MVKLVRLNWNREGKERSGCFIKIMNRYFSVFIDGSYMKKEDNDIIKETPVELNILGQIKELPNQDALQTLLSPN